MANKEYIERDAALMALMNEGCTANNIATVINVPAADVAPRSEVAMEIIGEIWANHTPDIDGFFTMHETELVNLKKKYFKEREMSFDDKLADATARSADSDNGGAIRSDVELGKG